MAIATVSLGGIKKKTASTSKNYPVFDGLKVVVNQLVEKDRQIKVLEGEAKRLKAEVAEAVLPIAIAHIKEGHDELGVSALGDKGSALVVYKNDFRSGADLTAVAEVIGQKNTDKLFRHRFSLKVDGDTLVDALGVNKTSKFVGELQALFEKHGVAGALESKEDFVPKGVEDLFEALTVDQVTSLNEVFKVPSSVSVK